MPALCNVVLALVWAALLQSGPAQNHKLNPTIPRRPLVISNSHDLGTPNFSFFGRPLCDGSENLYFHLSRGDFNDAEILRLRPGTGEPTLFQAEKTENTGFSAFYVNSDGELFVALENSKGEVLVQPYSSDGKPASEVKLDTPGFFSTRDFAVSQHGVIFLSGLFNDGAARTLVGKPYTAIFGPNGRLIRVITGLSKDPKNKDEWSSGYHEGAVTSAADGNFYVLQWNALLVISQSGKLIRRIAVQKPDESTRANGISISDGIAAVEFIKSGSDGLVKSTYLLLDIDSKSPIAFYEPEQGIKRLAACFTRSNGFVFTRSVDGHIRIDRADIR